MWLERLIEEKQLLGFDPHALRTLGLGLGKLELAILVGLCFSFFLFGWVINFESFAIIRARLLLRQRYERDSWVTLKQDTIFICCRMPQVDILL